MTQSIFATLADGLDASTDGRGWGAEHEAARRLADAAPAMLKALETVLLADKYDGALTTGAAALSPAIASMIEYTIEQARGRDTSAPAHPAEEA